MRSPGLVIISILIGIPLWTTADGSGASESASIARGKFAKPIDHAGPTYPKAARATGQEGWVEVSYVIGPDGKVHDPIVEDSSGIHVFEEEAIRTVKDWRFEPATWNGVPVEQSQAKVRLTFALEGPQNHRGASKRFVALDRKFTQLLDDGDLESAEQLLSEMFEHSGWNLYETTRLWISSYRLNLARSDEPGQLKSISRAAAGRAFAHSEEAEEILVVKFLLEARLGQIADAIDTYELLKIEAPEKAKEDQLAQISESINAFLNSDKILASKGVIPGSASDAVWAYRLSRRRIMIDSVDGDISNVDIRCDWRRANDDEPYFEKIWEVPASWGDCRLYVRGDVGTSFRLLELPDS